MGDLLFEKKKGNKGDVIVYEASNRYIQYLRTNSVNTGKKKI